MSTFDISGIDCTSIHITWLECYIYIQDIQVAPTTILTSYENIYIWQPFYKIYTAFIMIYIHRHILAFTSRHFNTYCLCSPSPINSRERWNCRWCQSERETELSPTVIAQVLSVVCHWAVGTSDASPRRSAVRYQKELVTTLSALTTARSNAVPIILTCQCSNTCIKNQDNIAFFLSHSDANIFWTA